MKNLMYSTVERSFILCVIMIIAFMTLIGAQKSRDSDQLIGTVQDESGEALIGANILIKGSTQGTITDIDGSFSLSYTGKFPVTIIASFTGFETQKVKVSSPKEAIKIILYQGQILEEVVVTGYARSNKMKMAYGSRIGAVYEDQIEFEEALDQEQYGVINESVFLRPEKEALSTFSIDVDRAAYSNVRRMINNGQIPNADAVRIEEMINYFEYDYKEPQKDNPLAINSTITDCPWNVEHKILHIGMQAKEIASEDLPSSNLVFLVDVSGSMNSANKLPLVKSSLKLLVNQLRQEDRVALVTYAGSAGVVLESTSAIHKKKIIQAIDNLSSGGSTAGAAGIEKAYDIALANYMEEGNNRVVMATDGDFNVGVNSVSDLEKLISKKRESGVFLSVLGYGMGNYKDEQMQTLADKGNGNHAYIDNLQEAHKVLVKEFGGSIHTLAKDVKFQIEFNPTYIAAYRLIGYENRRLENKDFNDDTKDAGEIGSGHSVTALYEIVFKNSNSSVIGSIDPLKYQTIQNNTISNNYSDWATIKFRYKSPKGGKSKKIVEVIDANNMVKFEDGSSDVRFAIAVAQFGMLLSNSKYIEEGTYEDVIAIGNNARGIDTDGYRSEFIRLAKAVVGMSSDEIVKR